MYIDKWLTIISEDIAVSILSTTTAICLYNVPIFLVWLLLSEMLRALFRSTYLSVCCRYNLCAL